MAATPGQSAQAAASEFRLTRELAAPPSLVFRAWTETARLRQWWGPRDFTVIGMANDLRPGGVCHYGLAAPDGRVLWERWVYREIQPPDRLVLVASFADAEGRVIRHPVATDWPMETLITLDLTALDRGTQLTLCSAPLAAQAAEQQAFRDGHASMQAGWEGTLAALAAHLSRNP